MFNTWDEFFNSIKNKDYFVKLQSFLNKEYSSKVIYPPRSDYYKAFELTPLNKVKVVLLGQDPYFNFNQAMGLSFSVKEGVPLPPSLRNIYKEIELEFHEKMNYSNGDLSYLANQGVLLLNAYLSVVEHKPLSHKINEYDLMLRDIMDELNSLNKPIVFLLFGNNAKKYSKLLTNPLHLIIQTNHPSPLSANRGGWFNSNCFIKTNNFLIFNEIPPINWIKK